MYIHIQVCVLSSSSTSYRDKTSKRQGLITGHAGLTVRSNSLLTLALPRRDAVRELAWDEERERGWRVWDGAREEVLEVLTFELARLLTVLDPLLCGDDPVISQEGGRGRCGGMKEGVERERREREE